MKKYDPEQYRSAIDRIPIPDGMQARLLTRLAADAPRKRRPVARILAVAAVIALLLTTGVITVAAIEAKEYRAAVDFFALNAIEADDLTRSEIKAVYRDIVSGEFAHEKTGEIILRESNHPIEGQYITPALLETLWNARKSTADDILPFRIEQSDYVIDYIYRLDEKLGFEVIDYTTVTRRDSAWSIQLEDIYIDGSTQTPHGLLVFGSTHTNSTGQHKYARAALIADDGSLVWDRHFGYLGRGFTRETLNAAVAEDDRIVLFGRGELHVLTVTVLDYAAEQLSFSATEIGNCGIREAVRIGDGYLVRVTHSTTGDRLLRLDRDGNLLDTLTYTADDRRYTITDMLAYNGRLYLSAYATPTNSATGSRGEIEHILRSIFADGNSPGMGELPGLVDDLRATYTAVLFLCDPASGQPTEFYAVDGAMGDALGVDDEGNLTWDTAHFATALFSPATSAFTVAANCDILRYTLSTDGSLLHETATGRTVSYAR